MITAHFLVSFGMVRRGLTGAKTTMRALFDWRFNLIELIRCFIETGKTRKEQI